MSFWKSAEHKARKKYRCELCCKTIQVGEKYSRQTGVAEGEYQKGEVISNIHDNTSWWRWKK